MPFKSLFLKLFLQSANGFQFEAKEVAAPKSESSDFYINDMAIWPYDYIQKSGLSLLDYLHSARHSTNKHDTILRRALQISIIFVLEIRKLRLRGVKLFSWCHPPNMWSSWDLNLYVWIQSLFPIFHGIFYRHRVKLYRFLLISSFILSPTLVGYLLCFRYYTSC